MSAKITTAAGTTAEWVIRQLKGCGVKPKSEFIHKFEQGINYRHGNMHSSSVTAERKNTQRFYRGVMKVSNIRKNCKQSSSPRVLKKCQTDWQSATLSDFFDVSNELPMTSLPEAVTKPKITSESVRTVFKSFKTGASNPSLLLTRSTPSRVSLAISMRCSAHAGEMRRGGGTYEARAAGLHTLFKAPPSPSPPKAIWLRFNSLLRVKRRTKKVFIKDA